MNVLSVDTHSPANLRKIFDNGVSSIMTSSQTNNVIGQDNGDVMSLDHTNSDVIKSISDVTSDEELMLRARALSKPVEQATWSQQHPARIGPPEFTRRLNVFEEVELGGKMVFECQCRGNPRPLCTWYLDDQEINDVSSTTSRFLIDRSSEAVDGTLRLIISGAQKSDEGAYKCRAENDEGVASTTGYLSILGSSIPLGELTTTPSSSTVKPSSPRSEHAVSCAPMLRSITEQQSMEEREAEAYEQEMSPLARFIENVENGTTAWPYHELDFLRTEEQLTANSQSTNHDVNSKVDHEVYGEDLSVTQNDSDWIHLPPSPSSPSAFILSSSSMSSPSVTLMRTSNVTQEELAAASAVPHLKQNPQVLPTTGKYKVPEVLHEIGQVPAAGTCNEHSGIKQPVSQTHSSPAASAAPAVQSQLEEQQLGAIAVAVTVAAPSQVIQARKQADSYVDNQRTEAQRLMEAFQRINGSQLHDDDNSLCMSKQPAENKSLTTPEYNGSPAVQRSLDTIGSMSIEGQGKLLNATMSLDTQSTLRPITSPGTERSHDAAVEEIESWDPHVSSSVVSAKKDSYILQQRVNTCQTQEFKTASIITSTLEASGLVKYGHKETEQLCPSSKSTRQVEFELGPLVEWIGTWITYPWFIYIVLALLMTVIASCVELNPAFVTIIVALVSLICFFIFHGGIKMSKTLNKESI